MDDYESLSHTKWDCKYHVVFIPTCRRKALHGELRKHLGKVFLQLAVHANLNCYGPHFPVRHERRTEIRGRAGSASAVVPRPVPKNVTRRRPVYRIGRPSADHEPRMSCVT